MTQNLQNGKSQAASGTPATQLSLFEVVAPSVDGLTKSQILFDKRIETSASDLNACLIGSFLELEGFVLLRKEHNQWRLIRTQA